MNSMLWFAWDSYQASPFYTSEQTVPWGVGSVSFSPVKNDSLWNITIGGSSQRNYEGKSMGLIAPIKRVDHTNGIVSVKYGNNLSERLRFDYTVSAEYLNWSGTLDDRYYDSLHKPVVERKITRGADELTIQAHGGIQYHTGSFSSGFNLLNGIVTPSGRCFIDPGIWARVDFPGNASVVINGGKVSSFPDIRGLPDESYRARIDRTYIVSARVEKKFRALEFFIEPYYKYRSDCPSFSENQNSPIWDPGRATPVIAGGVDISATVILSDRLEWMTAGTVGKSQRIVDGKSAPYEWDMPWTIKSQVHLHSGKEWWHLFVSVIISDGLPYIDIGDNNRQKRSGIYFRPDISVEYHTVTIKHRLLRRFDLYAGVQNVTDELIGGNKGDIYWIPWYNQNRMSIVERQIHLARFEGFLGGRFVLNR